MIISIYILWVRSITNEHTFSLRRPGRIENDERIVSENIVPIYLCSNIDSDRRRIRLLTIRYNHTTTDVHTKCLDRG